MYTYDCSLAGPLKSGAFNVFAGIRIEQNNINEFFVGSFHSSEKDVDVSLPQLGPEKRDKSGKPFSGPRTAREWLRRVKLILRHHHVYFDSFPGIFLDESCNIGGVSTKIPVLLDELVGPLPS